MLKSICIKTNNKSIINYLLEKFRNSNLEFLYISNSKFKFYNNVIIHYKGPDVNIFYNYLSQILADTIIVFYENTIVKNMLDINYFYFCGTEQQSIFKTCLEYLSSLELEEASIRREALFSSIYEYLLFNKIILLEGFVNFRIKNYIKLLDYVIDLSVNKFVVDKEYSEFIDLLKLYINSKNPASKVVHLIYKNNESILLDENKNLIDLKSSIFDTKYLSDITFSSNDFALNTLLTLLPEKIILHIVNDEDEFINTLKLIFDQRILVCNDCKICKLYNFSNNKLKV